MCVADSVLRLLVLYLDMYQYFKVGCGVHLHCKCLLDATYYLEDLFGNVGGTVSSSSSCQTKYSKRSVVWACPADLP